MRVAIDTNRLTDLLKGDLALVEQLAPCDEVWIPVIVLGEIKAGFYGGSRQHENEALLQMLLAKPTVRVLFVSPETAELYARLFVQLKRSGKAAPDNDVWIAALALEHNLPLITRDRHFDHIPQLLRA